MASEKRDHLKRGNIEAKRLLDTNNSVRSDTSDKLFSMLEAGESSGIPRDQIDQLLIDIAKRTFKLDTNKIWKDFRILLSVKDKIAFITAHAYSKGLTENNKYNNERLKKKLDKTLKLLECNLMQNEEFTESRILRNAAFNHFSCKLSTSEQADLNSVGNKLKKLCQDNGYDSLAESTHFTAESNAQKIMNYNEVARQLSAIGVNIDGDTLAKITKLEEKIKPLKDLNRKYINLSNNLALTSEIAKKGYKSMIHVSNQKKLRDFLTDLGKKETDFFLPEADSFSEGQFANLEEMLRQLKLADRAKYDELLKKYSATDNQFSEWFLVYFSYKNVEKAKSELDSQKTKTFGNELPDYEQTAARRRGNLRNKIFEIGGRMTGNQSNRHGGKNTVDFASNQDFEVANSYFEKFKNIFYANERDAYGTEAHDKESHYLNMRNTIAAIIRRRGGDVVRNGGHRRYGSLPRQAAKRLEWFAKGQEEKGFWKMVSKTRHHADHAEILAMVIMLQNQASQQMYHGRNPFQKKDSRIGKMRHGLSLAEKNRQEFGKTISPYTSKFMRGVETATKGVVGKPLVRGAQRYNKKLLGKSLSLTQEGELSKTKDGTGKYKRRKTPFYAALPVTRILAKGKDGYNNTKKYLGEVKGENIDYLYQSLNDTVDTITSIGGKTAETIGTKSYEQYQTNQERSVLDTFFSLASEDEHWKEVIQSCNLAGIFNFNNRETYLFDEDGRVPMLEAPEVKEKNAASIGKDISKNIKKQGDLLLKQAEDAIKEKKKKEKVINESSEEESKKQRRLSKISKEINAANEQKTTIKDIHNEIINLTPILEKPVDGAGLRKNVNIATDTDKVLNKLKNGGLGYIDRIETKLGDGINPGLKKDLKDAETVKKTKERNIKDKEIELRREKAKTNIGSPTERRTALDAVATIEGEIDDFKEELDQQNDIIEHCRIEITNNQEFLSRLQKIYNEFDNLKTLNTEIGNTVPTKEQLEKLSNFNKNLDILLYPEEKKNDGKTINLNDISEEKRKEIEKLLAI